MRETFKETTGSSRKGRGTSLALALQTPPRAGSSALRKGERKMVKADVLLPILHQSGGEKPGCVCNKRTFTTPCPFLTAAGPVADSDILQLLPMCEHFQMAATSIRERVITASLCSGDLPQKIMLEAQSRTAGPPRGCGPLGITKSPLLSSPGRELTYPGKNYYGSKFGPSPSLLCLQLLNWTLTYGKQPYEKAVCQVPLKKIRDMCESTYFYKNLGDCNIVPYPKTGKKIYFQNVCLLNTLFSSE